MCCPIVERSFSAETSSTAHLLLVCSTVVLLLVVQPLSAWISALSQVPHPQLALPSLPCPSCLPTSQAYSSCIAGPQPCILSNDCDISAPDISIVVSDSSSSAHNILLGHHKPNHQVTTSSILPPCIPKSAVTKGTGTVRKSVQQEV